VATGYTGKVHFTSSDGQAVLPADYSFTTSNKGIHSFNATLKTAGTQSLTATDTVTASITGSQSGITVNPAAATKLSVSAPTSATVNATFTITVTAQDAFNNTAAGYRGTITFTSSDKKAVVPKNYTFTSGDNGVHTFTNGLTLKTTGKQTVTATDIVTKSITGTATVTVTAKKSPIAQLASVASLRADTGKAGTVAPAQASSGAAATSSVSGSGATAVAASGGASLPIAAQLAGASSTPQVDASADGLFGYVFAELDASALPPASSPSTRGR
jgi:hypothetical protein